MFVQVRDELKPMIKFDAHCQRYAKYEIIQFEVKKFNEQYLLIEYGSLVINTKFNATLFNFMRSH